MNDKQIFARIIAGVIAAFRQRVAGIDPGHDGWGALWVLLMVLPGIAGFIFSAKWPRKRGADFQA